MAIAIKSSPILTGDSATAFVEDAERMSQLPAPRLNEEEKTRMDALLRRSKEFEKERIEYLDDAIKYAFESLGINI